MLKRQDLELFYVESGKQTPFPAAGLRVPIGQKTWAQIAFEKIDKSTLVKIAALGKDRADALPTLTIEPHAGNVVSVRFGPGKVP